MTLIDEATISGARVERACAVLGMSMRTLERWRLCDAGEDQRHGPAVVDHALTAQEQQHALQLANSAEYRDLPAEQVVARLADRGVYVCSERSLERLQHKHQQHRHRERSRASEHAKPREYVANGPNQVMTWDITYLPGPVRGRHFYLYLFLDIWSRRIMGSQVLETEDSKLSAELLTNICDTHQLQQCDVVLHSDNGAAMKGSTMLATMRWLGIRASFSRPGVSDDNAHVEALFRTLKYRPSYPARGFESIEQAREWVKGFVRWYNHDHLHSAIGFIAPDDRHYGRDLDILERRKAVYRAAQQRNPRRWTTDIRRWHRPRVVLLNPERATQVKLKGQAMVA